MPPPPPPDPDTASAATTATYHHHPHPESSLLPLLARFLPYSLPLYRRLQSPPLTEHGRAYASFAPFAIVEENDETGSFDSKELGNDGIGNGGGGGVKKQAAVMDGMGRVPRCFAVCYVDRSVRPETEGWVFVSGEVPGRCGGGLGLEEHLHATDTEVQFHHREDEDAEKKINGELNGEKAQDSISSNDVNTRPSSSVCSYSIINNNTTSPPPNKITPCPNCAAALTSLLTAIQNLPLPPLDTASIADAYGVSIAAVQKMTQAAGPPDTKEEDKEGDKEEEGKVKDADTSATHPVMASNRYLPPSLASLNRADRIKLGTVSAYVLRLLGSMGRIDGGYFGSETRYLKFIFSEGGEQDAFEAGNESGNGNDHDNGKLIADVPVEAGMGEGGKGQGKEGREKGKNKAWRKGYDLPTSTLRWGALHLESHFSLVRARNPIPRTNRTLRLLKNVAVYDTSRRIRREGKDEDQDIGEEQGDDGPMPVAWVLLGLDGSLTSLHTEPEYRGMGIAQALVRRLFALHLPKRDGMGKRDGLGHADVAVDNAQSRAVCSALGGEIGWSLKWISVDLGGGDE